MSTQAQPKELTIANLSKIHGKGNAYIRTIMCRPEFNQYFIDNGEHTVKFRNNVNMHKQIRFIIKAKENMKGKTCRGAY